MTLLPPLVIISLTNFHISQLSCQILPLARLSSQVDLEQSEEEKNNEKEKKGRGRNKSRSRRRRRRRRRKKHVEDNLAGEEKIQGRKEKQQKRTWWGKKSQKPYQLFDFMHF